MRPRQVWIGIFVVISGCTSPGQEVLGELGGQTGEAVLGASVVALVDTGINPYHAIFQLVPGRTPPSSIPFEMVPREFREHVDSNGPSAWNTLHRDQLYWFEGTKVLAISRVEFLDPPFQGLSDDPTVIFDDVGHGSGVASVVSLTSPNSWIVMVETTSLSLSGYRWAAAQPWIDIIASSRGDAGHLPGNITDGQKDQWAQAYLEAVMAGKIVINAGGNTPDANLLSRSGAPWVISVGGAEESWSGPSWVTSQPVDVVASFTVSGLARSESNTETYTAQGTSFGAPLVAGVMAEALSKVRSHYGHTGGIVDGALVRTQETYQANTDFRRALNFTARYWNTTDWRPVVNASNPAQAPYRTANPALPHIPGTPVGPWMQMGWGYVDGASIEAMVGVLTGAMVPPEKADAAAYMERLAEARARVWEIADR